MDYIKGIGEDDKSTLSTSPVTTTMISQRLIDLWLLGILEELKKSLLNNSFFGEASDAIFCIPMMQAAMAT